MANKTAKAGSEVFVHCPASGYPLETIAWSKDGQTLAQDARHAPFSNGTLRIDRVDAAVDNGFYSCRAVNKQGLSDSNSFYMDVISK
jgi:hypothetical protein